MKKLPRLDLGQRDFYLDQRHYRATLRGDRRALVGNACRPGFRSASCQTSGYDRDRSRRVLQSEVYDYYYDGKGDPVANDSGSTYGWSIDAS